MLTKTLGTTGADFTTINLWVSYVVANQVSGGHLTDSVTLDVLPVGYTAAAAQTISGFTSNSGAFTTTISASSGNSICDKPSASTALFYDATKGAFLDFSGGNFFLTVSVQLLTISRLQWKFGTTNYLEGIQNTNATSIGAGDFIVTQNIFYQPTASTRGIFLLSMDSGTANNNTITNNLFVTADHLTVPILFLASFGNGKVQYNTFINTGASSTFGGISCRNSYSTTLEMDNNAFVSYAPQFFPNSHGTTNASKNNATDQTTLTTFTSPSGGQTSLVPATEFVSATVDFRIKTGTSVKLLNKGATGTGITTDFFGTTRSGTTPSIGAWEPSSGSTVSGAGTAVGIAVVSGHGASKRAGVGSAVGVAVASAVGRKILKSAGAAVGVAIASGVGSSVNIQRGAGAAVGIAVANAAGKTLRKGVGGAVGLGIVNAVSRTIRKGVGSAVGIAAVSGAARGIHAVTGAAVGIAIASAGSKAIRKSAGASVGIAVATGIGRSTARSVGHAIGIAIATGASTGAKPATGTAVGIAIASGVGRARHAGTGNAVGIAVASGASRTIRKGVGTAQGVAIALGAVHITAKGAGHAVGVAVAFSTSGLVKAGIGNAVGIAIASGVGQGAATVPATGRAIGIAIALGISHQDLVPNPANVLSGGDVIRVLEGGDVIRVLEGAG